ncbi:MAG: L,D-transpeptidase family protein [Acidobacteria bacterium]|nr:L,D-transpeptidase family protein [Acidobacteriota bacterium]
MPRVPLVVVSSVLALATASATMLAGCGRAQKPDPVAVALGAIIAGKPSQVVPAEQPAKAEVWDDVHEFYRLREGKPAWVTDEPTSKANDALHTLQSAREHGLDPANYGAAKIAQMRDALSTGGKGDASRDGQLAEFEARVTTALLSLGRDVAVGRTKPKVASWKARRVAPDLAGTLNTAAGDVSAWLATVQPVHPEPSGVIDAATRAAMKVSIDDRIHQVATNLERWRWMPDDLGAQHLMVNIPSYLLMARENGKTIKDIRVVVGKPGNETPVFSGLMETVVFSPYWNIPDSIVQGETAPAVAKDPKYLARNNMEILRVSASGPTLVNPSDVNWDDPEELRQLAFRQRPGSTNALGHVKFLFPNPHNVYLHDTPADALFARTGRAFSHGCIRVEEPEELAKYVLRSDADWTTPKILMAMNSGIENHVRLNSTIPVHIVYFTAWVDAKKGLHFKSDVYGYDRRH